MNFSIYSFFQEWAFWRARKRLRGGIIYEHSEEEKEEG